MKRYFRKEFLQDPWKALENGGVEETAAENAQEGAQETTGKGMALDGQCPDAGKEANVEEITLEDQSDVDMDEENDGEDVYEPAVSEMAHEGEKEAEAETEEKEEKAETEKAETDTTKEDTE